MAAVALMIGWAVLLSHPAPVGPTVDGADWCADVVGRRLPAPPTRVLHPIAMATLRPSGGTTEWSGARLAQAEPVTPLVTLDAWTPAVTVDFGRVVSGRLVVTGVV